MNVVDTLWNVSLKMAAEIPGNTVVAPLTPPPPPSPSPNGPAALPPPAPTSSPEELAKALEAERAPFHGEMGDILERKKSFLEFNPAHAQPLIDAKNYEGLGLEKFMPSDKVDQMSGAQLAQAMRAHMTLAKSPYYEALKTQRLFKNPSEGGKALTMDELRGAYVDRHSQLNPEQQASYKSNLLLPAESLAIAAGDYEGKGNSLQGKIRDAVASADANTVKGIKESETNPNATGFTDWATSSWSNIAVPAGMLLMLFGGDTGMMLGGLAVAAGGYDMYNRYNVLTKDPLAQTAIKEFMDSKMDKGTLENIRKNYGDRYAKAALDYSALLNYGFQTQVRNKTRDAGMRAYNAYYPNANKQNIEDFQKSLPQSNPDENTTLSDWEGKGEKWFRNSWNNVFPPDKKPV